MLLRTAKTEITEAPGKNRLFIMKAKTPDLFGDWEFVGKPDPEVFSIDPTIYTDKDETQYMCVQRVDFTPDGYPVTGKSIGLIPKWLLPRTNIKLKKRCLKSHRFKIVLFVFSSL